MLHRCISFSQSNFNSEYTNLIINYTQLHNTEIDNRSMINAIIASNELVNRRMIAMNENTNEFRNTLEDIQHISFEQDREKTIETLYSKHSKELTPIEIILSKFDKEECCVCLSELSEYVCPHCNAKICKECFNELRSRNCECPACRVELTKIIQYSENENEHENEHENEEVTSPII